MFATPESCLSKRPVLHRLGARSLIRYTPRRLLCVTRRVNAVRTSAPNTAFVVTTRNSNASQAQISLSAKEKSVAGRKEKLEQQPPADIDGSEDRRQRFDTIRALVPAPSDGASAKQRETHVKTELFKRSSHAAHAPRHRFFLAWGSIGFVIITILGVIGVIFHVSPMAPKKGATPTSLIAIHFPTGHITCPESVSWAPDGETLAVLGYVTCSQQDDGSQGVHPIISLYNVASGREMASLPLESALAKGGTHGKPVDAYRMLFGTPTWTADGKTLGVTFTLGATDQSNQVIHGLAVLHATGSTAAITVDEGLGLIGVTFDTYNLNTTIPPVTVRYDTSNGSTTIVAPQPAFSYLSGASASLEPATGSAASAGSASRLPRSVTGSVTYSCTSSGDASATGNTNYYWVSAGGAAWSPDGRYFYSTLGAFGRLASLPSAPNGQIAAPAGQSCTVGGPLTKWTDIGLPLAGLGPAVGQMNPYQLNYLTFATSANSTRVVVSTPTFDANGVAQSQAFTIYDGGTGRMLKKLVATQLLRQAQVTTNQSGDVFSEMSWSADGRSLALLDPGDRVIVVLGPSQLR